MPSTVLRFPAMTNPWLRPPRDPPKLPPYHDPLSSWLVHMFAIAAKTAPAPVARPSITTPTTVPIAIGRNHPF